MTWCRWTCSPKELRTTRKTSGRRWLGEGLINFRNFATRYTRCPRVRVPAHTFSRRRRRRLTAVVPRQSGSRPSSPSETIRLRVSRRAIATCFTPRRRRAVSSVLKPRNCDAREKRRPWSPALRLVYATITTPGSANYARDTSLSVRKTIECRRELATADRIGL